MRPVTFLKSSILAVFLVAVSACSYLNLKTHSAAKQHGQVSMNEGQGLFPSSVKFAQFNVSFAHDGDPTENYAQWVKFMTIPHAQQNALIAAWRENSLNEQERKLAERIIQIRNVAAIIQAVRPDVLLLNEFNNDGTGEDYTALTGFQTHYLSHAQSLNSVDGRKLQQPIVFPFVQNYATNTGLSSGIDLNNTGYSESDPNDAYGFGFYHGHYAFALMSKYKIDTNNTRTFQTFKRKDLPEAVMPTINVCDGKRPLPQNMKCGDAWFNEQQWANLRLSSKNHVDAPIVIPTKNGDKTIHAFLSHPTPPGFDTFTDNNKYRNSEENAFWLHYISSSDAATHLYDDHGQKGGFAGASFVIMGDLNADAQIRTGLDPRFNGIARLMSSPLVNQSVAQATGKHVPTSTGATQAPLRRPHTFAQTRTSTFGSRADYSVPSANLSVIDSGVFWLAEAEAGRLLFNDPRIGKRGSDKEVSSDHRLVWVTIAL
ncbi:MAG: endonuclease/exonuclease/phosphatase family protein [Glaciecola sp.]